MPRYALPAKKKGKTGLNIGWQRAFACSAAKKRKLGQQRDFATYAAKKLTPTKKS
jgi:hypothetical protein